MPNDLSDDIYRMIREPMDPNDPASVARFSERLGNGILMIRSDIKKLGLSLSDHTKREGETDRTISLLAQRVGTAEENIRENADGISEIVKALQEATKIQILGRQPSDRENDSVTFKWATEKLMLPFIVAIIGSLLGAAVIIRFILANPGILGGP